MKEEVRQVFPEDGLDCALMQWTIAQAKTGNVEAARHLLGLFAHCLERGRQIDYMLLRYMTDALFMIARSNAPGEQAAKALHLVRGRGRPPSSRAAEKKVRVAADMQRAVDARITLDSAQANVGSDHHICESRARDAYSQTSPKARRAQIAMEELDRLAELDRQEDKKIGD